MNKENQWSEINKDVSDIAKKVKSKRVNKLRGEKYKNFLREIKQYNDKLNWANSIVKLYEYKK